MMLKEFFGFTMEHNLELLVKFHRESRRLMDNQVVKFDEDIRTCSDDERRKELIFAKEVYCTTFYRMLRSNTFLMMYSHLEEFLYHVWKIFSRKTQIGDRGSIKRFKPIFKEALGMDLGEDPDWQFICDCEKIRDCLLHANGRIDLLKKEDDKVKIERIVSRSNSLPNIQQKRIVLTDEFLLEVNKVLNSFSAKVKSSTTI